MCAVCRSRVRGYLVIRERLQEYREHWRFVDWVEGERGEVIGELRLGVR